MIGVFDSGVGGLTVVKHILKRFNSDIVYLGDTARLPYGTKSKETVTKYSIQSANFLTKKGVDAIVVACNTASSSAINQLRESFNIPVFGVIEPAAKKAANYNKICVIGTESTISSNAYVDKIKKYNPKATIEQRACPLFVPLVEAGWIDDEITYLVAKRYLNNLQCDALILGCTHYPLLKDVIKRAAGDVELIDSGEALSDMLEDYRETFEGEGKLEFYTTDSKEKFAELGRLFLGKQFNGVRLTDL
jgi:glutamate racemase